MAKYSGMIGFATDVEIRPGVHKALIVEKPYYGDVITDFRKLQSTDKLNDNVNISEKISIVANPYAMTNCHNMVYLTYLGARWKISNIEVQFPRLILSIGDVYNVADDGQETCFS